MQATPLAKVEESTNSAVSPTVVGLLVAGAGSLATVFAVRATSWAVMTDELQVARLATSIAETLSPVPHLHGAYFGALSQLYPLLIAPFYGLLPAPAAATAAHAVNGFLLASAALPAYLLGRSVSGSRLAGCVAGALTAFVPWLVLASTILTENAAYPAFVWAVFLCHRALVAPSAGRDLAALAGLAVAFFARTQLFVLAAALPIALLCHEVGFGGTIRAGARRAVATHRVLTAAYAIGGMGAAALAAAGSLGGVVGNYAMPFEGDLLPAGIWHSAAVHFVRVVVAGGVVPFLLAASWGVAALWRPERKEAHAFAVLLIALVPLLTLEVASFDLRFTPQGFVQDRYLLYLAPLFAVGSAAALAQRTHRAARALLLLGTGGLFAWLAGLPSYHDRLVVFWAAPAAAFHPALRSMAGWAHLSPAALVRWGALALAAAIAAALWRAPARATLVTTGAALAAFGAFQAVYVFHRFGVPSLGRAPKLASLPRDWIDRAVPNGKSVALLPSPSLPAEFWWEAEFWNKRVDRTLRVGRGGTYTPFPADRLSLDFARGELQGKQPTDLLLVSATDRRFGLAEATPLVRTRQLSLARVERPYRLAWAMRGAEHDGWTRPGKTVTLRVYAQDRPVRRSVRWTLISSPESRKPFRFALRTGAALLEGRVDPGGGRATLRFALCAAAGSFAQATLLTDGSTRIPDGRRVSLHLERVEVGRAGQTCAASKRLRQPGPQK